MERVILHSDMNNFYASVECMLNPELKGHPVAVCGATEDRHGIVLAKNYEAKKYKIQTGEVVWQRRLKMTDLWIAGGFIVGSIFATFTMCLAFAAKNADRAMGIDE